MHIQTRDDDDNDARNDDTRRVFLGAAPPPPASGPHNEQPPHAPTPQKKIITHSRKWARVADDLARNDNDLHWHILQTLVPAADAAPDPQRRWAAHSELFLRNVREKIGGYRSQDLHKHKFDPRAFVDINAVLALLHAARLQCHYCLEPVRLLYENVRDGKQWSLDRIDNDRGHDRDNLFLACLTCNLRRRCLYHEKYTFTRQLRVVKVDCDNRDNTPQQQHK